MAVDKVTEEKLRALIVASFKNIDDAMWFFHLIRNAGYIHPDAVFASDIARLRGVPIQGVSRVLRSVMRNGLKIRSHVSFRLVDILDYFENLAKVKKQISGKKKATPDSDSYDEAKRLHEWERVRKIKIERQLKEGALVEVAEIWDILMELSTRLRQAGEEIGKQYSPEAQKILNDAIDDFKFEIERGRKRLMRKIENRLLGE